MWWACTLHIAWRQWITYDYIYKVHVYVCKRRTETSNFVNFNAKKNNGINPKYNQWWHLSTLKLIAWNVSRLACILLSYNNFGIGLQSCCNLPTTGRNGKNNKSTAECMAGLIYINLRRSRESLRSFAGGLMPVRSSFVRSFVAAVRSIHSVRVEQLLRWLST